MKSLDIRTLILVADLIALFVAVVMALTSWNARGKTPCMMFWTLGFALRAAGFWGIFLRDSIPKFVSQPVANTAIMAGALMFYVGVRAFLGKPRQWALVAGVGALSFGLCLFLTYGQDSYNLRVATISLVVAAIECLIGFTLLGSGAARLRFASNWVATVFLFEAGLLVCRAFVALAGPPVDGVSSASMASLLGFLPALFVPVGLGFGFISMINARSLRQNEELIANLETALSNVKTLTGLLPICAGCKKIRDDKGYWHQMEVHMERHSQAQFSHGICPDCEKRYFPGVNKQ